MAETKHFLSVYSLLGILSLLTSWNDCVAETTLRLLNPRVKSSHVQENRQEIKREPDALHTSPKSNEEKQGRPTVGSQAAQKTHVPGKTLGSFPGRPIRNPSVIESTLSGRVERWVGNFMPSREPSLSKKLPVQTKVYIFKGKLKSSGTPEMTLTPELSNKVFSVINSNPNGDFKVQLPPGEYTVFAEIEGKLYRNSFDGEGHFSTTQIEDGKASKEVIVDSTGATF